MFYLCFCQRLILFLLNLTNPQKISRRPPDLIRCLDELTFRRGNNHFVRLRFLSILLWVLTYTGLTLVQLIGTHFFIKVHFFISDNWLLSDGRFLTFISVLWLQILSATLDGVPMVSNVFHAWRYVAPWEISFLSGTLRSSPTDVMYKVWIKQSNVLLWLLLHLLILLVKVLDTIPPNRSRRSHSTEWWSHKLASSRHIASIIPYSEAYLVRSGPLDINLRNIANSDTVLGKLKIGHTLHEILHTSRIRYWRLYNLLLSLQHFEKFEEILAKLLIIEVL